MRKRRDLRWDAVLRQGTRDLLFPDRGSNQPVMEAIRLSQLKAYARDRVAKVGRARAVAEGVQDARLMRRQIIRVARREPPQQRRVACLGLRHPPFALRGRRRRIEAQHLVDQPEVPVIVQQPWSVVTSVYTRIQKRTSGSSSGGYTNGSGASAAVPRVSGAVALACAAAACPLRSGVSRSASAANLNSLTIGGLPVRGLPALGVAAIQAGVATVHHHHRGGAALRAQLCALRKMRLRKGIGLLGSRLELRALFLHELALMLVQLGLLEQSDRLQVAFDDVAQLGDGRRHEFPAGLPVAALRIEYRLQLV